jgi:DHA1 family tetracycline resistance protein-like MFS transporter
MQVLTARSLLYGLRENMVRAVWQPFVLSLGASVPLLGFLESLGGFWGFVPTAMLPLGGWISDRRGRKALLLLGNALSLAGLLVLVIAAWTREWLWLVPGVVLVGASAIARPAADSITAESTDPAARGQAFGLTSTFYATAGVVAPTVGGWLAERHGFLSVMLLGTALELAVLAVTAAILRETLRPQERSPLVWSQFATMLRRTFAPPARLRSFYITMTVDAVAFGTCISIFSGLLSKTFGFTPFQLGLLASVSSLTWAATQWFVGRQVDKRGTVPFMLLSEVLAVVIMIGYLLARSFTAFLALQALWGLTLSTWMPAFMAWIANSVSEKERAEEMGRMGAFRGLVSFPAPYVGGLLYTTFGFRGPIVANIIGAVVVIVLMLTSLREPQPPS